MTSVLLVKTQQLTIQDLNNNNGYIMIKLEEIQLINNYTKILHIINTTEYETAAKQIQNNINTLEPKSKLIGPIFTTIKHSFKHLETKIKALKPHYRQKRGLINILGTGLKYITGTMDSNDEIEIKNELDIIKLNNKNLINENNKQVKINQNIMEQIKNISNYVTNQQEIIGKYFDMYNNINPNEIAKLENEVKFLKYVDQISYDIGLLKDHVDDVEQIILTSKLGVLSKNILTLEELNLIQNFESLKNIKTIVTTYEEEIIIILMIPNYSEFKYSRILIEPIPNNENKSIVLKDKIILVDKNNVAYKPIIKDDLIKNLINIKDLCISKIVKYKEAECIIETNNDQEIKEISPGLIITKNINFVNLKQNCNNFNLNVTGNNIILYENCTVKIHDDTYESLSYKIQEHFVLPNVIVKINEDKKNSILKSNELIIKQINNRDLIREIINEKYNTKINWTIIAIIMLLILLLLKLSYNFKKNHNNNFKSSSEPQTNVGGVIDTHPHTYII